ncbi:MAG: hypothetical protein V3T70_06030, partial [Phycisphaerae bacterium]
VLTLTSAAGFAGLVVPTAQRWLAFCVATLAVLLLAEFMPRHQTKNAALAARLITRGRFAGAFWGGVVVLGLIAPAALLWTGGSFLGAVALIVAGIAIRSHLLVQAPQHVPLS